MNIILSEYFTLDTSVKNEKDLTYCLFHPLKFRKTSNISLQTTSLDNLFVVKKYIYSNFGSNVKSPV